MLIIECLFKNSYEESPVSGGIEAVLRFLIGKKRK